MGVGSVKSGLIRSRSIVRRTTFCGAQSRSRTLLAISPARFTLAKGYSTTAQPDLRKDGDSSSSSSSGGGGGSGDVDAPSCRAL